jgi:hypothetical protein
VFKVYEHGQVLDECAAVVGTVQASHGLVWYLVELAKRHPFTTGRLDFEEW